jgi:hypothetical protein
MSSLEAINGLKTSATHAYLDKQYAIACQLYGEQLQAMISYETPGTSVVSDDFGLMKAQLFSNMALGNLKLDDFESCRRLCNAALIFIAHPGLLLDDLGSNDIEEISILSQEGKGYVINDINVDVCVFTSMTSSLEHLSSNTKKSEYPKLVAKCLYRRALAYIAIEKASTTNNNCCNISISNRIVRDLKQALVFAPKDSNIVKSLEVYQSMPGVWTKLAEQKSDNENASTITKSENTSGNIEMVFVDSVQQGLVTNGGYCYRRRGLWSQTVENCIVYLPLMLLYEPLLSQMDSCQDLATAYDLYCQRYSRVDNTTGDKDKFLFIAQEWLTAEQIEVNFCKDQICVGIKTNSTIQLTLELEYRINAAECTWQLSDLRPASTTVSSRSSNNTHIELSLVKTPPVEVFPGCEWFDRICIEDEAIDTQCCAIDVTSLKNGELPIHASLRAEKEANRFMSLDDIEKSNEVGQLLRTKHEVMQAMEQAEVERKEGEKEAPGRSEMLAALSAQFPNINFASK